MILNEPLAFYSILLNIHWRGVLTVLFSCDKHLNAKSDSNHRAFYRSTQSTTHWSAQKHVRKETGLRAQCGTLQYCWAVYYTSHRLKGEVPKMLTGLRRRRKNTQKPPPPRKFANIFIHPELACHFIPASKINTSAAYLHRDSYAPMVRFCSLLSQVRLTGC